MVSAVSCWVTMPCAVQGRPVYIQLLGKIDINTLKQITTEERMIKFHIQEYERCGKVIMPICSKLAGRQIDQTFGIMDVKGELSWGPPGNDRLLLSARFGCKQQAIEGCQHSR